MGEIIGNVSGDQGMEEIGGINNGCCRIFEGAWKIM